MNLLILAATDSGGAGAGAAGAGSTSPASAIGWTIAVLLTIGFAIAVVINVRRGRSEVGAEVELAPNRKPYLSDEELEGKKLDRTLGAGLLLLAFISVALPLYWLYEPARQEGAVEMFRDVAETRGHTIYETKAQCVSCHGPDGTGGAAETTLLDESGNFIGQVKWQAPALDTVLYRFTYDEVKYILEYGRPNTPMPAWGAKGGGPLTDQQLDNTIAYLESIQLSPEKAKQQVDKQIAKVCAPDGQGNCTVPDPGSPGGAKQYATLGEALFNLGLYDNFAGGAYSCGRCHTKGWSYGKVEVPGGGGPTGFNLTNGATIRRFETPDSQIAFISKGSEDGKKYGTDGLGSGKMPGFGLNPNAETVGSHMNTNQVMLSQEQIAAIVAYERSL